MKRDIYFIPCLLLLVSNHLLPSVHLFLICWAQTVWPNKNVLPTVKNCWCWADLFSFVGKKCWAHFFTPNSSKLLVLELLFPFCLTHFVSFVGQTFSILLIKHFFLFCWAGVSHLLGQDFLNFSPGGPGIYHVLGQDFLISWSEKSPNQQMRKVPTNK